MKKLFTLGFLLLLLNSAYLWGFPDPNLFYISNVVAHIVGGGVVVVGLMMLRDYRRALIPLALVLLTGVALAWVGAIRPNQWLLLTHIAVGVVAALSMAVVARGRMPMVAALAGVVAVGGFLKERLFPNPTHRIKNPQVVALNMEGEGGGPASPFFPSASVTNTGKIIPSNFFMDSKACAECHQDIYDQWNSSMHHFASFNNQFYRKSIEYMQDVAGLQPSKWCAGCHDHAVFFNGRFEKPIKDQIDTPEAHNGLGCMSCHSISAVDNTAGNGGFRMEYPPLHQLTTSDNKFVKFVHNYIIKTAPEAHRRSFIKPFMRLDASEFCSSCHKVHLDIPVNNYRWFRGFNEYDNWQASGVSGQGARSFYYPPKSSTCVDCHMPKVASKDFGNVDGQVHNHRFPGANTAVPYANKDEEQLKLTQQFLKDGNITVDIFAASPVKDDPNAPKMRRRAGDAPSAATTFAVGEEAEGGTQVLIREVGEVAAPLDVVQPVFRPGDEVRVDVVVRTRKVGHFFPGGTVDAFDVWLELKAEDELGKAIFWSGMVEDGGRGPVEPGAHFYKSFQLDEHGNPINKRNAWQTRSVLYVRLIPPGAADVAHFRIKIPKDAKGRIKLTANVNYRKFAHYYTQFAYSGKPDPNDNSFSKDFDDRKFTFGPHNIPANVSGQIKDRIPDIPITVVATTTSFLNVGAGPTQWKQATDKKTRERWNDWGIGLLLQGDLKAAEYAFKRVTEAEPEYADGWLNIARAYIQEGQTDEAKPFLEKALSINKELARIHYFKALVQKADGDYDGAIASLRTTVSKYPRDRVAQNQLGRILFLKREYKEALKALDAVQSVDSEDIQMHYTKMLAYRGLGDTENAAREEKLFLRFKVEEAAQAITNVRRMASPEDNNERQTIHDHEGVELRRVAAPMVSKDKGRTRVGEASAAGGGSK
jgi:tetratricopeptide (TPR) repeat protein